MNFMKNLTVEQFLDYFKLNPPTDKEKRYLQVHYSAPHHGASMGEMAQAVGYRGRNRGMNLRYGLFATKVARYFVKKGFYHRSYFRAIGKNTTGHYSIGLFVSDFDDSNSGRDSVLTMTPNLVRALEMLGWVRKGMPSQIKLSIVDAGDPIKFEEGGRSYREVFQYERSPKARKECIRANGGPVCAVCGLSFGERYGSEFEGLISVHHLRPLAYKKKRNTNPKSDMKPLCPNCHAMAHYKSAKTPRSIDSLKEIVGGK